MAIFMKVSLVSIKNSKYLLRRRNLPNLSHSEYASGPQWMCQLTQKERIGVIAPGTAGSRTRYDQTDCTRILGESIGSGLGIRHVPGELLNRDTTPGYSEFCGDEEPRDLAVLFIHLIATFTFRRWPSVASLGVWTANSRRRFLPSHHSLKKWPGCLSQRHRLPIRLRKRKRH